MSLRIAHLSDVHFGGESPDAVEAAVAAVAEFNPTLTVVSGDLTLNGLPREFRAARDWLARLPLPQLVTPGNHDTPYWNLLLRALTPFARYRQFIGPDDEATFAGEGLRVHAVNSARGAQPRPNWAKGAMALRRLATLDWGDHETLKAFVCHHPLIDIEGAPVTGGVRRGERAAEMLVAANVELILTGHVHNPFALALPGLAAPCYALGAGTLSVRTRGTPAGFSFIIAEPGAFEVRAMGWAGGRFEPFRSWKLPRRPLAIREKQEL